MNNSCIKFLKIRIKSMFKISSPSFMAMASSIGILIGMMPLIGIKLPLIIVISLLFGLNILCIIAGVAVTIIFPYLNAISFKIGQHIAGYDIPFYTLRYLYFSYLKKWSINGQYHLVGSIIAGIVVSLVFYPIFKWIYNLKFKNETFRRKSIFYDNTGLRWTFLKRFLFIFMLILIFVISIFGISLSINPFLPGLGMRSIKKLDNLNPITSIVTEKTLSSRLKHEDRRHYTFQIDYKKHHKRKPDIKAGKQRIFAFYVNWDPNSAVSFKRNIHFINTLVPEWYHLNKNFSVNSDIDNTIKEIANGNNVRIEPLINNYIDNNWDGDIVHRIISKENTRKRLEKYLLNQIKSNNFYGINLDFENLQSKDEKPYVKFVNELCSDFHKNNLEVTVDVPAEDSSFDYDGVSRYADYVIAMMYDEHYSDGVPGPIASLPWYSKIIENMDVPQQKLIVSLGNYGYDWTDGSNEPADDLTFGDIIEMAQENKLAVNWDKASSNPYIRYKENGDDHTVWFLDGAAFYNQYKIAVNNGAAGIALYRLGSEDQSIWDIFKDAANTTNLQKLTSPEPVKYIGGGEILKIISLPVEGKRNFSFDKTGLISNENYISYPSPFEIQRFGKASPKEVALTFDDGPDPVYTPQILNILKKNGINATFFIIGENAEINPDIVERTYNEGNEIGNHTFTHPNVAEISPERARMELNATERLIEEITGHSTIMFRAPYVADAEPSTPNELLPVLRAQQIGYTMIGELIDPDDWQKPPYNVILSRIMSQIHNGNVILLHDGGGDRSRTVKALPLLINILKKQGYKFVTISDLLGKNRDAVMPPVINSDDRFLVYDRTVFTIAKDFCCIIGDLFYAAIILGILRFIMLIFLSYRQKLKYDKSRLDNEYRPFVSIVIAAYNEEKVITKTIKSILQCDYKNIEIIAVDDGSKDNTSGIIRKEFSSDDRVRLIVKENGGKSSAVNRGFKEAKGDIIVALDADTIIAKDAVSLLIRHFSDKNIAAVSGNVKVGNVHNLLTLWQHVEYVTGFNLERRAFAELNCITVVPGAIGAWRKQAVEKLGYFKDDTLAEDTDITLSLLEKGYKIAYEEKAYAYTESPDDFKSFIKQRFRWSYGTLQCLWKHKKSVFNKKYKALGFIGLPNMWLFQYIFQVISPVADIYFVIGLFGPEKVKVLIYYSVFFIMDYISAYFAFKLERENPKPLVWLWLQRIIYRQMMVFVIIKSIIYAFKGASVGWNKLQRLGNVNEK